MATKRASAHGARKSVMAGARTRVETRQPAERQQAETRPGHEGRDLGRLGADDEARLDVVVDARELVGFGRGVIRAVGDVRDLPEQRSRRARCGRGTPPPRVWCRPRPEADREDAYPALGGAPRGSDRVGPLIVLAVTEQHDHRRGVESRRAPGRRGGRVRRLVRVVPSLGVPLGRRDRRQRGRIPAPTDVPRSGPRRSIAASTALWSSVGTLTEKPASLNATTPICDRRGLSPHECARGRLGGLHAGRLDVGRPPCCPTRRRPGRRSPRARQADDALRAVPAPRRATVSPRGTAPPGCAARSPPATASRAAAVPSGPSAAARAGARAVARRVSVDGDPAAGSTRSRTA